VSIVDFQTIGSNSVFKENGLGYSFDNAEPNSDKILETLGDEIEIYQDLIEKDPKILPSYRLCSSRINKFMKYHDTDGVEEEHLEYIKSFLSDKKTKYNSFKKSETGTSLSDIKTAVMNMNGGVKFWGYNVLQIIYAKDSKEKDGFARDKSGLRFVEKIEKVKESLVSFDKDGDLICNSDLIEGYRVGQKLNTDKFFILTQYEASSSNPYGMGEARLHYYISNLRQELYEIIRQKGLKNIVPSVIVKLDPNYLESLKGSDEEKFAQLNTFTATVAKSIESLRNGSAAVVSGIEEIIDIKQNGSLEDLAFMISFLNRQSTEIIHGVSETLELNERGSAAKAGAVEDASLSNMDITNALIVQKTVNNIIERVIHLRYGEDYICPYLNYNVKRKAPLDDYLKLIDRDIDVKKEDLYSCIGGEPKKGEGILAVINKSKSVKEPISKQENDEDED